MGPFPWAGCLARTRRLLCWRWILSLGWGSSGRCSLARICWRSLPFVLWLCAWSRQWTWDRWMELELVFVPQARFRFCRATMNPPFLLNLHQIQGHSQPHIYRKSKENNHITISSFPLCYCCRTRGVLPFFEKKVPVHTHCFVGLVATVFLKISDRRMDGSVIIMLDYYCSPMWLTAYSFMDYFGVVLFRGDGGSFVVDLRYCASACRQGIDHVPTSVSLTLSVRASSF